MPDSTVRTRPRPLMVSPKPVVPAADHPERSQTVHFVHPHRELWPEGIEAREVPSWETLAPRLPRSEGSTSWILQTYVRLKRLGCRVRLSDRLVPGQMNVLHYDHLWVRSLSFRAFVIVVRADRGEPILGNLCVVQNQLNLSPGGREWWVSHWPQPGLQPREPSRGNRLQNLGYFGKRSYLAPEFCSQTFHHELASMGMQLTIYDQMDRWADYRHTDAVLAVRKVTDYDLTIKPPSKLLNAWHGRCVPLMGPEPAYRQVGRRGVDYLEVATPEQVVAALRQLRDQPQRVADLIAAGRDRCDLYSNHRIARAWIDWLWGPAVGQYHAWRQQAGPVTPLYRAARYPWQCLRHWQARRYFHQHI